MRQFAKLLVVLLMAAVMPAVGDAGPRRGLGFGFRHGGFERFHRQWPPQPPPRQPWAAPGRQLDTAVEFEDGRPVYRVRWITNQGRRIDYVIDAASGRYIGER